MVMTPAASIERASWSDRNYRPKVISTVFPLFPDIEPPVENTCRPLHSLGLGWERRTCGFSPDLHAADLRCVLASDNVALVRDRPL